MIEVIHVHEPRTCPTCGKSLTASASLAAGDYAAPAAGDVTVCVYCGRVLCVTPELGLRVAELADVLALDRETRDAIERAGRQFGHLRPAAVELDAGDVDCHMCGDSGRWCSWCGETARIPRPS